jgi:hypothetical protein
MRQPPPANAIPGIEDQLRQLTTGPKAVRRTFLHCLTKMFSIITRII